jgi:hypothetical protein
VSRWRAAVAAPLLAGLLLSSPNAAADAASAEELFRVGRRLLATGEIAKACSAFEESQRLDPSSGTLLSLADCHARQGRTASAWAEFLEAERLSLAQKRPDRAREARTQADSLEVRLSRLEIRVGKQPPGTVVERNGERVAASSLGVSLPVDPGSYEIRVSAAGHAAWEQTVEIREPGVRVVDVPRLEPVPAAEQDAAPPPPNPAPQGVPVRQRARSHPKSVQRRSTLPRSHPPTPFWVFAGTGVVATGVAAVFGGLSIDSYAKAEDACPGHRDCTSSALDAWDRARTQARIANVGAAIAILATGTAALLYFDKPDPRPARATRTRSIRAGAQLARTR